MDSPNVDILAFELLGERTGAPWKARRFRWRDTCTMADNWSRAASPTFQKRALPGRSAPSVADRARSLRIRTRIPAIRRRCPTILERRGHMWPHGKKGRSCSPN